MSQQENPARNDDQDCAQARAIDAAQGESGRDASAPDGPARDRKHFIVGVGADGSSAAIQRYLAACRGVDAPADLRLHFDERNGVATLWGTVVPGERREKLVQALLRVHGVARVLDRMTAPRERR